MSERAPVGSAQVLATGMITLEQIFGVDHLPDTDAPSPARTLIEIGGGSAANAAVAVARMGGKSQLVGCVGSDAAGLRVLSELERLGIDVTRVQRTDGATTPITVAIVDRDGRRIVVEHVSPVLFEGADAAPAGLIGGVDAVLVDCGWPAAAIETLRAANEAGIPAIVDADRPLTGDAAPILELGSHVVFSRDALCATAQTVQPVLALRTLRTRTSAWCAVTEGVHGVTWLDEEGIRHRNAFPVQVVDTRGAGDTFHGALAVALAEGRSEEDAIEVAAAAAALTCTRAGGRAGIPDRAAVEQLLANGRAYC